MATNLHKLVMKESFVYQILTLLSIIPFLTACSETEYVGFHNADIFPFEISDTTVSCDAHEFTVTQTNIRDGWEWKYWGIHAEEEPGEFPIRVELSYDEPTGIYSADWIRVKVERTSTKQSKFTIWIDENTTQKSRSYLIYVSTDTKNTTRYCSSFIIHQLPAKENEDANDSNAIDNILKVRYHGRIYESEVTTDSTGTLTYANKELQELLEAQRKSLHKAV